MAMDVVRKTRALLLGLSMLCLGAAAGAQDVVIVANKGVSASSISVAQLQDIFIGVRTRLSDGSKVVPVVLKGGPAHEVFLRKHVGDNPDEFRARWRKAVFTGQASMLKECNTEKQLLEYVATTPGAIGYATRVSQTDDVKVLAVSP